MRGSEDENRSSIHLHKDGFFWRAYNVSAFLFAKNFRNFKVSKRNVKSLQKEICFLGFPEKSLLGLLDEAKKNEYEVRTSESHIQILGLPAVMGNDFEEWFEKIPLSQNNENRKANALADDVLFKVKNFPLLEKSPLESQSFLWNLQKMINGTVQ